MSYKPNPVDVSGVQIPGYLQEDIEKIARDVHDVWAQQRLDGGWGYGGVYDSENKQHPCLIHYDELPEVEKDMDRATVVRTIKLLLLMGYQIEKTGVK